MGIGYTLDTPVKVAHLGIDSVISLVDDMLIEKLRKVYCNLYNIPYQEITEKEEDFRAVRISSYLNLINSIAERKLEDLKSATLEKAQEIKDYFSMLPDTSVLKQEFKNLTARYFDVTEIKGWIRDNLIMGSIDVNIMTKIDKDNTKVNEEHNIEMNDAHAALRGYANSNLSSSLVLSAGMNKSLYGYLTQFDDFFPDAEGNLKKKIVLKVSDFRSAFVQGNFLAKKGIWVSEYRIESGVNCGGHAFVTEGYLMGPILAELREKREELISSMYDWYCKALKEQNRPFPSQPPRVKVTAQGGVGTAKEHQFLIDHYNLDSVGWGTPFLLVPEATSVDEDTITKLIEATEKDLYLSNISPLGVPFNSLRTNSKDAQKQQLIDQGKPGSTCPKRYIALNTEYTKHTICTASRQYQKKKIQEISELNLSEKQYKKQYDSIVEKSCICVGLGTSALLVNNLDTKREGNGVSVCPGQNMAYFSRKMTLKEITDHIYGRANMISRTDRPNVFVNELRIYLKLLADEMAEMPCPLTEKDIKHLNSFVKNLSDGIAYYFDLFNGLQNEFRQTRNELLSDLTECKATLQTLSEEIEVMVMSPCCEN